MEKYRRANAYITNIAQVEHVSGFQVTIDYSYHIDGLVQEKYYKALMHASQSLLK